MSEVVRALPPATAGRFSVKVAMPPSATDASGPVMRTMCAAASFSSTITVTEAVPRLSVPLPAAPVGVSMVKTKLSSPSARPSLVGVMTTVPVMVPAGIVSVPDKVVMPLPSTLVVAPVAVVSRSGEASLLGMAVPPSGPARCDCGPITAVHGTITAPPLLVLRVTVRVTSSPSSTSPVPAGAVRATDTMLGSLALMVTLGVPLAEASPTVVTVPSVSCTSSSASLSISAERLRVMVPSFSVEVSPGFVMVRVPPVAVVAMPLGAVMS